MHKDELLWGLYQEQRAQCRHHEEQRASMSGLVLVICAAALGIISLDNELSITDAWLTGFLGFLGLFGAAFSAKHYERYQRHFRRGQEILGVLQSELAEPLPMPVRDLENKADQEFKIKHPAFDKLHWFRLHYFWIGLHISIAAFGLIITAKALNRY